MNFKGLDTIRCGRQSQSTDICFESAAKTIFGRSPLVSLPKWTIQPGVYFFSRNGHNSGEKHARYFWYL